MGIDHVETAERQTISRPVHIEWMGGLIPMSVQPADLMTQAPS
jgi:hypothetical protein